MTNEKHDKMVSRMRGRPIPYLGFTICCDTCEQRGETVAMSETVANHTFVTRGWRMNEEGDMLCPLCSEAANGEVK